MKTPELFFVKTQVFYQTMKNNWGFHVNIDKSKRDVHDNCAKLLTLIRTTIWDSCSFMKDPKSISELVESVELGIFIKPCENNTSL